MEKFFKVKEHGSTVRVEVLAGITTFMAMSYILMVNAGMFSALPEVSYNAIYIATALSAVVLCSRPYPRRLSADACSFYDGRICQCFTAGRLRQDTVGYAFPWCIGKHHLTELGTA